MSRHKRKPSGLACELSLAHELATSEPLDDRSLYVDLANLRGLNASTQSVGGYVWELKELKSYKPFFQSQ